MPPVKKSPIIVAQTKLGESIDALTESVQALLAAVIEDYDALCAVGAEPVAAKDGPRGVPTRESAPATKRPGRPPKAPVEDEFDDDLPEEDVEEEEEVTPVRKRGRPAGTTATKPKVASTGRPRKSAPVDDDEFEEDASEEGAKSGSEEDWDDWGDEEEEEEKPAPRRSRR